MLITIETSSSSKFFGINSKKIDKLIKLFQYYKQLSVLPCMVFKKFFG